MLPTLMLELTGKNKIEALAGKLYAYPKVGVWPLNWEGRFTIFEWSEARCDLDGDRRHHRALRESAGHLKEGHRGGCPGSIEV